MSTTELKELLHQQIDRLNDPADLQDLAQTVSEFVGLRTLPELETPELLEELQRALTSAEQGRVTSHADVILESKRWITS